MRAAGGMGAARRWRDASVQGPRGGSRTAKHGACKTAAMNAGEMAGGACGKQARPAPQGAKPVRPCRVSHAAAAERPGGAGNIFAPCVISGSSTRKRGLGGKIRAPCILNRPIAPGNGCMGRGCCHLDLEKHAFRADVARKGAFFAHSAKKGCIRCGSCQSGPWGRRNARREMGRDADVGARWARWGAMSAGSARWRHRGMRMAARGGRDAGEAGGTSRWQRPRRRFWICSMAI